MSDITNLRVITGDITNIVIGNTDTTVLNVQNGDVTTLLATPATITLDRILTMSDVEPSDIARESSPGILEIASRADHVHSIANTLLDGGNY